MRLQSKHSFIIKIVAIILLSLPMAWLFIKEFYLSSIFILIIIITLAISLYKDRIKIIRQMERVINSIHNADFSIRFARNSKDDEFNRLMQDMDEALEIFRKRTNDSMMEETEVKAWQKLISVLTHEIMNSIAPIISLSETLSEDEKTNDIDVDRYQVMKKGMTTIHRRGKGLLSFVDNYRKLTRLPTPVMQPIHLESLFQSIQHLVASNGIEFTYSVYPSRLILKADKDMIEQLLINLLKNANEACAGIPKKKIELKAEMIGELIHITVSDNGHGISSEALDKIFIPFYSTKINGSGIGLSLCRQIVSRHKGKISVSSNKQATTFKMEFP